MYRIHRRGRSPWWFSTGAGNRFDLSGGHGRGTCYLAEQPMGGLLEVFRDVVGINRQDLARHLLSAVRLPQAAVLADCTAARARGFGITAAIHSGEDYRRTRAWAGAFAKAGFDGVRYLVSHDPRQRLAGVALFGPAGSPPWPAGKSEPIGLDLLARAERRFGIVVLPEPRAR